MTSLVSEMFEQTCRTCLSTSGEMVSIFSSESYVNHLPKKLMTFARVEISENDGLPKVICKKCMFLADSFYCFKEQCESADNSLKAFILRGCREDNSPKERWMTSSGALRNWIDPARCNDSKLSDLDDKTEKTNTRYLVGRVEQETEEDYVVEYVSDDVRIQVENAYKRRQEAERRISMKKVTQSIKNLKGIEVVPISDRAATRSGRNFKMKKEEIVVFPVKVAKKRQATIETIVIDDPPSPNKRTRLPRITSFAKNSRSIAKNEDSILYSRLRKLNFSTVRKVVKMNDQEHCIEPKQEYNRDLNEELCQPTDESKVIVIDDDNSMVDHPSQCCEDQCDDKGLEIAYKDQYINVLQKDDKVDPELEVKIPEMQLSQFSDSSSAKNKNTIVVNETNEKQDISITSASIKSLQEEVENHSTDLPTVEEVAQEFEEMQNCEASHTSPDHDILSRSTVGGIINAIDDPNIEVDDEPNDVENVRATSFESANNISKNITDDRVDKCNEFFIETEITNTVDNCPTIVNDGVSTKNSTMKDDKIASSNSAPLITDESCSNQVTPLALLSVSNSSSEKNNTINLRIYQRKDLEDGLQQDTSLRGVEMDDFSSVKSKATNLKFYQCTICSINFASMPTVLKHNVQEHMGDEPPFFCLICDKSFQDKPSLSNHVDEHNGLKPYKCTFCSKTFTLKRNLKRHVNHHINYKPFQCRVCMKRFTEKSSLKSHMYLHTGDSPFACKSCNVSFNNKTNWRRHVMTIHEKLTAVTCKFCKKELPDKRSLQVHNRIHTGDKPYQCPHCDKRFTQQCNLNTHIHCHLDDRPFGCPHCGKGFNQRGTRDDHILTHTGEKPYKCFKCDAGFTVSSALKRHMWIHTDKDRPYNCNKCELQFVGLYDLRRHLKNKHGQVVKPENPRVERVMSVDTGRKSTRSSGEADIEPNAGVLETVETSIDIQASSKKETTADTENNLLPCDVTKFENVEMKVMEQMEQMEQSSSETKLEDFSNEEAEDELLIVSETLAEDDTGLVISGAQISEP